MIKRILVSLDGSPESEAILGEIDRVAAPHGAIDLLHVIERPALEIPGARSRRTEGGRPYLELVAGRFPDRPVGLHVRIGDPEVEIPRAAADLDADLIAITTHARKGLSRLFMGSVAESVVRHSPVPVLLTRPDLVRPKRPLGRILVPTDGSAESRQVIDTVRSVSRTGGVEVILLQVVTGEAGSSATTGGDLVPNPAASLRTAAYKLEREGLKTRPMVVFGAAADQILEQARLLDVDLIAMAGGGRSGLSRAFRRSISFRVLRHADRPVLLDRTPSGPEPGFVSQPLHVQEEEG